MTELTSLQIAAAGDARAAVRAVEAAAWVGAGDAVRATEAAAWKDIAAVTLAAIKGDAKATREGQ